MFPKSQAAPSRTFPAALPSPGLLQSHRAKIQDEVRDINPVTGLEKSRCLRGGEDQEGEQEGVFVWGMCACACV